MDIEFAHVRIQNIDCAIFDADAASGSNAARSDLLARLTARAREAGLAVSRRALCFREGGRLTFFGDPDLVRYLQGNGHRLRPTHTLRVG